MPKNAKDKEEKVVTKPIKKSSSSKKTTTKKSASLPKTSTKSSKKTASNNVITKTSSVKTSKKRPEKNEIKPNIAVLEYYDLPYRYNQTVVKVLSQTPTTLFVYWDIADEDRQQYLNQYGNNFFHDTKPVLVIHNQTKHYTFEIDINDFANSWYLTVPDSKCDYVIELGRRPIKKEVSTHPDHYISIISSNCIQAPNDHILFENKQDMISFKDVKTNQITKKPITYLTSKKHIGKIYDIYDVYQKTYKEELENLEILSNPSSGNPTSTFK